MATETGRTEILEEAAVPPRARILKAARELFYRHGLHTVSVDAIAEAADTNKTTLYRHFASKDDLVAECLREYGRMVETAWAETERVHAGQPKEQLLAWLRFLAEFKLGGTERGCAFANAAVELPEPDHPARRVIEEFKRRHRDLIIELCCEAGLRDPSFSPMNCSCCAKAPASPFKASGRTAPPHASLRCSKCWSRLIRRRDPDGPPRPHLLTGD